MLKKSQRLPIQSISTRPAQTLRGPGLTLRVYSTNLPYGRFGIIIPKAVAKTAVLRNKLKRAAFDSFMAQAIALTKRDLLCLVSQGGPLTKNAMMKELTILFKQLK